MECLYLARARDEYPGLGMESSKGEYASFKAAVKSLRVKLQHDKGTTGKYSATEGITLPAENADLATLVDEFLHAWNDYFGRGKYLPAVAARAHRTIYQRIVDQFRSTGKGSSALAGGLERTFHQLEALNFVLAPEHKPNFLSRVMPELLRFAHCWELDCPGGDPSKI